MLKFNRTKYYEMAVFDLDMIQKVYAAYPERVAAARKVVGRPLTLTEKILYAHLWDQHNPRVIAITSMDNPYEIRQKALLLPFFLASLIGLPNIDISSVLSIPGS